ncbi:glycosyltransferase [Streptomyces sp. LP05-1]|uniref:D-inositol 3-phosphate glycosyltransferase n=1 Tax=Streptomyces pyxinae TaxID=2970734 RepID=A0ABT2CL18_9ACTN|nr:glycosyltransferase [Streptomyces sp. LP05-1]MCS0638112.1 glycosyltransferase [Streptomyces sp. LP05-1]
MNSHVLYLALGTYRVRAAREHVRELAGAGSRVALVVVDAPEWSEALAELSGLAGVEVTRVAPGKGGSPWQAAKRLVADKSGPFAGAGLLIAGDAQALPIAWIAQRRYPATELRLEPSATGAPVPASDLAVITPWYPSPNNPYAGSFVRAATAAVAGHFERVTVFHTEDWSGSASAALNDAIKVTSSRLQERGGLAPVLDTPEGSLVRVPVPLVHRKNYAPWVSAQAEALRRTLPGGEIDAPVVHAHTGIYGGVLASRLARPDARVIVTEHASFLDKVFAQAPARRLYREVLERADAFLCVSARLRDQVAARFPEYAHKLGVVPNVIGFERFAPGPERSPRLLRWLYVGRLAAPKGVTELLEAFALVAAKEPEASLTLVGHGPVESQLRSRAGELGLKDRVRILPPVAPDEVGGIMREHDLLVHASKAETFGMTVVEAVATGLPVLVTRSGGPEESLAGIESRAGALMDISDDPAVIADAYWELRDAAGALDPAGAREVLAERYGSEAVARRLIEVYEGAVPPAPVPDAEADAESADAGIAESGETGAEEAPVVPVRRGEPLGRAVVLALTPAKPRRIVDFVNHLVGQGVEVILVTARSTTQWENLGVSPSVPVYSIEMAEKKLKIPRGERFLVYRAPRAALRRARRLAARNRDAIGPELAVASVQRAHTRVANAFHKKVWSRTYTEVRPQLLSRLVNRQALPELNLDRVDHVFVSDVNSTVTGWKWAKAHPHLKVTTHLDRETYAAE